MENTQRLIAHRFQIDTLIAQGGMGSVYRGIDQETGQLVAVKQIRSELVDSSLIARFTREGETLRSLNHRNIVKLIATAQQDGEHYIIMEYIGGGSLADLLAKQPQMPVAQTLSIMLETADALAQAHHLKIVHRDFKPGNILLTETGIPCLSDFGVASNALDGITSSDHILGTLGYLAPELMSGTSADARADIWAFGVVLFEMLAGRLPFNGDDANGIISAILTKPPPDLEVIRSDAPIGLIDLIYRMLEKDRHQRIDSMRQIAADLEVLLQEQANVKHGAARKLPPITQAVPSPRNPVNRFSDTMPTLPVRPRGNLPAQATPFVGREAELTELARLLGDPDTRLITILGPGGMGKTRLAIEAAQESSFSDGVFFVSLAPLTDPDTIALAVAEAIGIPFAQGGSPRKQLLDYCHNKHLLLVLDNFEHLLSGVGLITELLSASGSLKLLVTSRERLNFQSETLFRIEGMAVPDWKSVAEAADYSAIKLFLQGARRVQPAFKLDEESLAPIAQICRSVYGMPLGILLAAAWLDPLPLAEIAREITRSIDFLDSEQHDVPERQRSIRAVFDSSWRLLTVHEQAIFQQFSLFRGGFTREAAQAVTGAALQTLGSLINKSLLRRDPTGRYDVHELLRQYAEGKLTQAAQTESTGTAHSHYYLAYLTERGADLISHRQRQVLRELEIEAENIRAAWQWAVDHADAAALDQAKDAMRLFHVYRATYEEGSKLFVTARDHLPSTVDQQPNHLWYALDSRRLAPIAEKSSDWKAELEAGLAIAESQTWYTEIALYEARLGALERGAQTIPAAIAHFERSVTAAKSANRLDLTAEVYHMLAYCWSAIGQLDKGLAFDQLSLELSRTLGSDLDVVHSLHDLGAWSLWLGQYKRSEEYYREAVSLSDPRDFHYVFGLGSLGLLLFAHGDLDQAVAIASQLSAFKNVPDSHSRALQWLMLGVSDVISGQYVSGLAHANTALSIDADVFLNVYALFLSCMVYWGQRDLKTLWNTAQAAILRCQAMHNTWLETMFCAFLVAPYYYKGRVTDAIVLLAAIDAQPSEVLGWTRKWALYAQLRLEAETSLTPDAYARAQLQGSTTPLTQVLTDLAVKPLFG